GGPLLEAGVAGLVDYDQDLLHSRLLELLPGTPAGESLRLPHVDHVRGQRVERAETGVDRDDLDALRRGLSERIPKSARVGDRGRDDFGSSGDRGVDAGDLLRDVVV